MSRPAQIRAALAAIVLGLLLAILTVLDIYGDKIMKRALRLAAVAGVCLLAACTAGCTGFGRALVPTLKPIEAGLVFPMKCSDLAAKVTATSPLNIGQMVALYSACEQMQGSQKITIDPEAARKSLGVGALIP